MRTNEPPRKIDPDRVQAKAATPGHVAGPGHVTGPGHVANPGHVAAPGHVVHQGQAAPGHGAAPGHVADPGLFHGRVAASGLALGLTYRTDRPAAAPLPRRTTGDSVRLVTAAFEAVAAELAELATQLRDRGQPEQADIMQATGYIAGDPDLTKAAVQRAEQGVPATIAIRQAADQYADMIAAIDDPTLAERAADVRQVGRRALSWLAGDAERAAPGGPLVLVAQEIGAADLLETRTPVAAALSVTGGPNSHAAIVARSLSIPLLVGIDPGVLELADGVEMVVDGERGTARLDPPALEREAVLSEMVEIRARRTTYATERNRPSVTLDGHRVVLRANAATVVDARLALERSADGIGLLRTELPFLQSPRWPTEAQHTRMLLPILGTMAGQSVTVRTLDFADDKLPPFLAARRTGSHLGRGLPLMLSAPDAFGAQFRAILSAAPADSDIRIMIPMVANLAEVTTCQRLLRDAAAALGVTPPPLGIMVELPEAVERAPDLAAASSFVSIGSNDLTSQILGLDRRDPAAGPAMTAHPRVLTAIARVVSSAHRLSRTVSVCGDAAAHPLVVPLLVGLGVDVLSVPPTSLDEIRYRIRRLHHADCTALAAQALNHNTAEQVWDLVRQSGTAA